MASSLATKIPLSLEPKLLLGDCREILQSLPSASVDALVSDPPYGLGRTACGRVNGYGRRCLHGEFIIAGDESLDVMTEALALARRVLKPSAWAVLFCSPKRHAEAIDAVRLAGYTLRGEAVWNKRRPGLGAGIRYQHETILLCSVGKPAPKSSLMSVLTENSIRKSDASARGRPLHPHEKPVAVMAKLVAYVSACGETILDPFMGSGSTGIAAIQSGRAFIGIESDPGYFNAASARLSKGIECDSSN